MAKMNILEMVQNILSAMDSDEVNSISDTVEALQVATVLKDVYFELTSGMDEPSFENLLALNASIDVTHPTYMSLPSNVKNIKWVKYNYMTGGNVDYHDIKYLTPEDFIIMTNNASGMSSILVCTDAASGAQLVIQTNKNPSFWTTFDNQNVIFDSYDADIDDTLQQSKVLCWGQLIPIFSIEDNFIPVLDADMFPQFLAEAKSVCFVNFKQVSNSKSEQQARRQRVRRQNDLWRMNQRQPYNRTPDYGRKGAH